MAGGCDKPGEGLGGGRSHKLRAHLRRGSDSNLALVSVGSKKKDAKSGKSTFVIEQNHISERHVSPFVGIRLDPRLGLFHWMKNPRRCVQSVSEHQFRSFLFISSLFFFLFPPFLSFLFFSFLFSSWRQLCCSPPRIKGNLERESLGISYCIILQYS